MEKVNNKQENTYPDKIYFKGGEEQTEVFLSVLDNKLGEFREQLRIRIEKGGDFEPDLDFLSLKYMLHIGNAIRFKAGAEYVVILESLKAQDGFVNLEIYKMAWLEMNSFVKNLAQAIEAGQIKIEPEKKIQKIQISTRDGTFRWREVSGDGRKSDWIESGVTIFDSNRQINEDSYERFNAFLLSKYGPNKKIESFSDETRQS